MSVCAPITTDCAAAAQRGNVRKVRVLEFADVVERGNRGQAGNERVDRAAGRVDLAGENVAERVKAGLAGARGSAMCCCRVSLRIASATAPRWLRGG